MLAPLSPARKSDNTKEGTIGGMLRRMTGSMPKRAMVTAGLAMLVACGAAPPQDVPEPAQTAQAFAERRPDGRLVHGDRADWLNAALSLNPDLAEIRASQQVALAARDLARQRDNPILTLSGGYFSGDGVLAAAANASGWLYGLTMELLLPRPGARQRAIDAAGLQALAAQAELLEGIWRLRMALRGAQLAFVHADRRQALLAEWVAAQAELRASVELRISAGALAPSDIAPVEQAWLDAQNQLQNTEGRLRSARLALAAAVGLPPDALDGVSPQWPHWAEIAALDDSDLAKHRAEAVIARPDVVRAVWDCERAEIALQEQASLRQPDVRLAPAVSWDNDSREYELGIGLPVPWFHRNEAGVAMALAQREQLARRLISVQAAVFAEIAGAEENWRQARHAWQAAVAQTALSRKRHEAERRNFEAGVSDRERLLQARIGDIEARLSVLDAAQSAQSAFGALESAYRRPLEGPEAALPMSWRAQESL